MDEGLAQYREAIRVEPDDEFSSVRRAITTSLKQLGPAHPDAVPSMLSLVFSGNLRQPGFAAERRRLLETGLDLHQQLLSESRDDPAVLRQAGKAFTKLQLDIFPCEAEMTHRVAISVRERLLVLCPEDADSHYWLAMHQLQRGRACGALVRCEAQETAYRQALAGFDLAVRGDPSNLAHYIGRGEAYRHIGDYERAAADFTNVLERSQEGSFLFRKALQLRGVAYLQGERKEDALRDYERLLKTKSVDPDDWCTLPANVAMVRTGILLDVRSDCRIPPGMCRDAGAIQCGRFLDRPRLHARTRCRRRSSADSRNCPPCRSTRRLSGAVGHTQSGDGSLSRGTVRRSHPVFRGGGRM